MRRVLFSSGLLVAEAVARKTSLGRHESSLMSSRHHGKGSDSGLLHLRSSLVGGGRYDSGIFSSQVKSTTEDGGNSEENKKAYKTKGEEKETSVKKRKKGQEGKSGESGEAPPKKRRHVRRKKPSDEEGEQTGSKKLKSSLFEARLSGNKDSGDETTGEPQPAKKPVNRSEDTSKKGRSSSGLAGESKKTEGTKEDESPDTSREETGTKGEGPVRSKRSGMKSIKDSAESELVESDGDHSSDIGEPIRD